MDGVVGSEGANLIVLEDRRRAWFTAFKTGEKHPWCIDLLGIVR